MTTPPEPAAGQDKPSVEQQFTPLLSPGIRWSDIVAEIEADRAAADLREVA